MTPARSKFLLFLSALGACSLINSTFTSPPSKIVSYSGHRLITSGLSSWVAQGIWISKIDGNHEDPTSTMVHDLHTVLSLDPFNTFYRINAAGILAYDLPSVTNSTLAQTESYIQEALKILEKGLKVCPEDSPYYFYEFGKIYLLKYKDTERARSYFIKASQKTSISYPPT